MSSRVPNTLQIFILGLLTGLGPFAVDLYLPATNAVASAFSVDTTTASLNISLFLIGMAFGNLVAGPISDVYGRRPLLLFSVALVLLSSLAALTVTNIELLIGFRCLQAVGTGMLAILVNAIISDTCDEMGTARLLSLTTFVSICLRIIAPILGGYLVLGFGWRGPLCVLAALSAVCLVYTFRNQHETHNNIQGSVDGLLHSLKNFLTIMQNTRARTYVLFEVLGSIALFAFVVGAPIVFLDRFTLSSTQFGYIYASITVVMMLSAYANNLLVKRYGINRMLGWSIPAMAITTLILLIASVFYNASLSMMIAALSVFVIPMMMTRLNALAGAIKCFPEWAGTTASLVSTIGFALGGIIGVKMNALYEFVPNIMAYIIAVSALFNLMLLLLHRITMQQAISSGNSD